MGEGPNKKRLWITLSFLAVFSLGVPMWWKSTEIYRAELPYTSITALYEEELFSHPFPIAIHLFLTPKQQQAQQQEHLDDLLSTMQRKDSAARPREAFHTHFHNVQKANFANTSCAGVDAWLASQQHVELRHGHYAFVAALVDQKFTVCPSGTVIISEQVQADAEFLHSIAEIITRKLVSSPMTEEKMRKRVQTNSAYRITFSLLQDTAGWDQPLIDWEFPQFLEVGGVLHQFFERLAVTADISVDSQIRHFVTLLRDPEYSQRGGKSEENYYYFDASELPYILAHPNEWNSDFVATDQPSLHFVVYVPPQRFTPLVVRSNEDLQEQDSASYFAYVIPQTGGVVIYNRSNETQDTLTEEELHEIVEVFIEQLRTAFGLNPFDDVSHLLEQDIHVVPSPHGIAEWERDQIIRDRTYENLQQAISNLNSLAELLQKLTNMMISDHIQTIVQKSLDAQTMSYQALREGQIEEAQRQSLIAMERAHEAFFDPDMLSLLYFPDEHKFAIYTPLFLPISVPVILKLVAEIKKLRAPKKTKEKQKTE